MGRKLYKPSGNKITSWGDRQVERIKFAAALESRGAPWRPGAALASRGAGDALRGAGKLCERRVIRMLAYYYAYYYWAETNRKTIYLGLKNAKTDQLYKYFRLKRIAAAQKFGRSAP